MGCLPGFSFALLGGPGPRRFQSLSRVGKDRLAKAKITSKCYLHLLLNNSKIKKRKPPIGDKEEEMTEVSKSQPGLTVFVEKAIEQLQAVDERYSSYADLDLNIDLDGNICTEPTGITLNVYVR